MVSTVGISPRHREIFESDSMVDCGQGLDERFLGAWLVRPHRPIRVHLRLSSFDLRKNLFLFHQPEPVVK